MLAGLSLPLAPPTPNHGKTMAGRPTLCTPDITDAICQRLAGGKSLRSVCEDEAMPEKSTVLLWVVQGRLIEGTDRPFSDQYMQAREAAGYSHADRVADLATMASEEGIDPQAARAAMDGFKWAAERMAPKKHSPRQEIDHSSKDGSMTPSHIILSGPNDDGDTSDTA